MAGNWAVRAWVDICLFGALFPTQYIFFFNCRKNNLGIWQKQLNNSETGDFFFSNLQLDQIFIRCRSVGTFLRWEVCGTTNASLECGWWSSKAGSSGFCIHVKKQSTLHHCLQTHSLLFRLLVLVTWYGIIDNDWSFKYTFCSLWYF